MMKTWSERSVRCIDDLYIMVSNYIAKNKLPWICKKTFVVLNDKLIIKPLRHNGDYHFISVILMWFYGDAEMAIVHRYNNDTEFDLVTNEFLDFENKNIDREYIDDKLMQNKIKYYPFPFDERVEEIYDDIIKCLKAIIN